ncbi:hypothetical protein RE474_01065 [Methanolobus sediminis]|uniref:Uncharacterized protein n=1 Tax=Methanolobus sediminis TaxID=3072978 RepID=A0AA51UNJ7_9EURY|nr:hypothetical protein [Methanolobus sediminis]WMW25340.1 hypothetical protein RE474_01065 [Methanolobus sediminis]
MDNEICTLEKCETEMINHESMDNEVSQTGSQDYSMEPGEDEQDTDVTGYVEDSKADVEDVTNENLKQTSKTNNEIGNSANILDNSASGLESDSELANSELITRLEDAETRYNELETRLFLFEEKFNDMQKKMSEKLESSGDKLSTLENDLYSKVHESDYKQLRQDFDLFSKRLKRVVQAEDSVNAETLDPTKVPPDVLEITYAKTLNDLYGAMISIYGDRESADMVETARDQVREFSAGVDFFSFENETFVVRGLSDAIASKIVSVKQIHGTYVELFKMLFQYVPNYNSQDFRSFVETGSREYTIEKVVSHEKHLEKIVSDLTEHKGELDNLTENVTFIAELQNNQLEESASNTQQLEDIKEQMKSIAKAVNLHTKAITKLNRTLKELNSSELVTSATGKESEIFSGSSVSEQESEASNASKEEIMAIAGEIESFKVVVGGMFNSLQEQLQIHIPGYGESFIHDYPEQIVQENDTSLQDNVNEGAFSEESPDINVQAGQLEQEEFLPEPVEVISEPDQMFADQSPMPAETAEISPEPLNLEDFAPDQNDLVPEAESIPVGFEFADVTPEEVPLDLESLDLSPDEVPVDFESSEVTPEEVPLDFESLDMNPDEVPVVFESEVVPEEVPLDLESLDLSPDEVPVIFESEVVPEEVPLDLESLDLSPDEVPVIFESEVVPEEVPLDLESLDLSPDEILGNQMELTLSEAEIVIQDAPEQPQPIRLKDMPIEEVIVGQLSIAGSATLKQLEKQIQASGYPIDFEKISLVMDYLEQERMVDTVKKGRYTFYSVAGAVNV